MFIKDPTKMYVMPITFGPAFGPRQNMEGERYLKEYPRDVTNHTIVYESDGKEIEKYLPPNTTLDAPYVIINHRANRNLSWLAGRGYNLISVRVPATYHGKESDTKGYYMLAIWENVFDPILFGREQLGYCKLYAEIDDVEEYKEGLWHSAAFDWGFNFIELEFNKKEDAPCHDELEELLYDPERKGDMNYRYVPRTGNGFTEVEAEYMTLTPKKASYPEGTRSFPAPEVRYCDGICAWHMPRWEQTPTQYRIFAALADLPIKRFLGASWNTAQSLSDTFNQEILR